MNKNKKTLFWKL